MNDIKLKNHNIIYCKKTDKPWRDAWKNPKWFLIMHGIIYFKIYTKVYLPVK